MPVLGVNLGRIGFLAEAEADINRQRARPRHQTRLHVEERMTLDVLVRAKGGDRGPRLGPNEASLERGRALTWWARSSK